LSVYLKEQYQSTEMFADLLVQEVFQGQSLFQLWSLWELLISETPLMVMGDNPKECSHAVMVLISLLHPLKPQADYRPYVTIFENDTKELITDLKQGYCPNVVIGSSNPLFNKTM